MRAGRELRHYPAGTTRDAQLAASLWDVRKRLLMAALARPDAARRSLNQAAHQAGLPFGAAKRTVEHLAGLGLLQFERRGFRYAIRVSTELRGLATPS